MLWVAVDFNVENDMPSFSSQAIFMVCNVLYCSVTLLTLQLESYVTDPCQKASGARRPKAEGVRMDAHRAETGVHAGLGSRQPPLKGARTDPSASPKLNTGSRTSVPSSLISIPIFH